MPFRPPHKRADLRATNPDGRRADEDARRLWGPSRWTADIAQCSPQAAAYAQAHGHHPRAYGGLGGSTTNSAPATKHRCSSRLFA